MYNSNPIVASTYKIYLHEHWNKYGTIPTKLFVNYNKAKGDGGWETINFTLAISEFLELLQGKLFFTFK